MTTGPRVTVVPRDPERVVEIARPVKRSNIKIVPKAHQVSADSESDETETVLDYGRGAGREDVSITQAKKNKKINGAQENASLHMLSSQPGSSPIKTSIQVQPTFSAATSETTSPSIPYNGALNAQYSPLPSFAEFRARFEAERMLKEVVGERARSASPQSASNSAGNSYNISRKGSVSAQNSPSIRESALPSTGITEQPQAKRARIVITEKDTSKKLHHASQKSSTEPKIKAKLKHSAIQPSISSAISPQWRSQSSVRDKAPHVHIFRIGKISSKYVSRLTNYFEEFVVQSIETDLRALDRMKAEAFDNGVKVIMLVDLTNEREDTATLQMKEKDEIEKYVDISLRRCHALIKSFFADHPLHTQAQPQYQQQQQESQMPAPMSAQAFMGLDPQIVSQMLAQASFLYPGFLGQPPNAFAENKNVNNARNEAGSIQGSAVDAGRGGDMPFSGTKSETTIGSGNILANMGNFSQLWPGAMLAMPNSGNTLYPPQPNGIENSTTMNTPGTESSNKNNGDANNMPLDIEAFLRLSGEMLPQK